LSVSRSLPNLTPMATGKSIGPAQCGASALLRPAPYDPDSGTRRRARA
jgi:hypothetical protein